MKRLLGYVSVMALAGVAISPYTGVGLPAALSSGAVAGAVLWAADRWYVR